MCDNNEKTSPCLIDCNMHKEEEGKSVVDREVGGSEPKVEWTIQILK
jgi:hypothetical protein